MRLLSRPDPVGPPNAMSACRTVRSSPICPIAWSESLDLHSSHPLRVFSQGWVFLVEIYVHDDSATCNVRVPPQRYSIPGISCEDLLRVPTKASYRFPCPSQQPSTMQSQGTRSLEHLWAIQSTPAPVQHHCRPVQLSASLLRPSRIIWRSDRSPCAVKATILQPLHGH